jgi:hypothetical protein
MIFRSVNPSSKSRNEKKAVKTGIRFEKIFDLLIPINFTECAKQTNDTDEASTANKRKEVIISLFIGIVVMDLASKMRKNGRNRKMPIKFW